MNIIARRIVTGFVLAAAPAVIAVGAAAGSQAETTAMADTMATEHRPAATQSHTAQHGATALTHRHRHHGYYHR